MYYIWWRRWNKGTIVMSVHLQTLKWNRVKILFVHPKMMEDLVCRSSQWNRTKWLYATTHLPRFPFSLNLLHHCLIVPDWSVIYKTDEMRKCCCGDNSRTRGAKKATQVTEWVSHPDLKSQSQHARRRRIFTSWHAHLPGSSGAVRCPVVQQVAPGSRPPPSILIITSRREISSQPRWPWSTKRQQ